MIYLICIADMSLFRNIIRESFARTHLPNWLVFMVDKMHYSISRMSYTLFHGFAELLFADCPPQTFKFDRADGQLFLEPHLLIRCNTKTLSLSSWVSMQSISAILKAVASVLALDRQILNSTHVSGHVTAPQSSSSPADFIWARRLANVLVGPIALVLPGSNSCG